MKLGIIGNVPPPVGGAEVFLKQFLREFLKKEQHRAYLVRWRKQISFYFSRRVRRVFASEPGIRRDGRLSTHYFFEAIEQKPRERRRHYQNRLLQHYMSQAFEAAEHFKRRDVELIQVHMLYPNLLFGALASQYLAVPLVLTIHGMLEFRLLEFACKEYGMLGDFTKALLQKADTVIAVSDEVAKASLAWGAKRIEKIGGGVNTTHFVSSPHFHRKKGKNILFIGSIRDDKGAYLLIEAFEKIEKEVLGDLVFVGERLIDGPIYQRAVRNKRIHFLGIQGPAKILECLNEAALLVLPSESEGLSISVLEAMAHRRPVLVSKSGDLATVIREGRNGFLIQRRDAATIARQMKAILKRKRLGPLGDRARKTALQYDIRHVVHRYETLYRDLLSKKKSRR